jgi:Flp pilus assembly protein TadD
VVDLANKRQREAAVDGWRKILKLDPENAKAHNNLGVALIQRGRWTKACALREGSPGGPGAVGGG